METRLRRIGRNLVLVGYGAVTITLCRAIVDVFSEFNWSGRIAMGQQLAFGVDLMVALFLLGMLSALRFVVWIARTNSESASNFKLAKLVSLGLASQSAFFAFGLLAYVVNEATMKFTYGINPGFRSFGWWYPTIGSILLAGIGYLLVTKSFGVQFVDVHNEVPDHGLTEN
jgi:hypothetical protein